MNVALKLETNITMLTAQSLRIAYKKQKIKKQNIKIKQQKKKKKRIVKFEMYKL